MRHVQEGGVMSRYRKGAGGKRDANEPDIIKVLRAHGCVVMQLSGKGIPDLLVLRNGTKWLADVKMPGKPTTEAQEELWGEAATKARCAVFILRTPEDAVAMLNNALQPWEPTPSVAGVCSKRHHVRSAHDKRRGCTKAHPRIGACGCRGGEGTPRESDAAKARKKVKPSSEVLTALASLLPSPGYTPPRSARPKHSPDCEQAYHKDDREPCTCGALDSAKEAEATFALAEPLRSNVCLDPDKMNGAGDQFPGSDYD